MRKKSKAGFSTLLALALFSMTAAGCAALDEEGDDAAADEGELGEEAAVVPRHAIVTCESASFYRNYDSSSGPVHLVRTLARNNKIGHTPGAHPVHNGWAATHDFGPGDWGFMRIECIGGYDSW